MRDIQTIIMGNATADPTAHPQEDGSVTAKVRVAVTGRYYNTTSQDFADRKTEFITVFVRRQLAQNVLRSVRKGQPVIATGRLNTSEWTGDDGAVRHSLNLQAESIGHDLTYGTAVFRRPLRSEDTPDVDPGTGEIIPRGAGPATGNADGPDGADRSPLTGEETTEDDSLAAAV